MRRTNNIITALLFVILLSVGWYVFVQSVVKRTSPTPSDQPDFRRIAAGDDFYGYLPLLDIDATNTDRGGEGDSVRLKITSNVLPGHVFRGGEVFTARILATPLYRGRPNNMLHVEELRVPIRYDNTYLKLLTVPTGDGSVTLDTRGMSEECNFYELGEPTSFVVANLNSFNSFYFQKKFPRTGRYADARKGIQLQPDTCIGEIKFQVIRKEFLDPAKLTSLFVLSRVKIPNIAREIGPSGRGPEGVDEADGMLLGNIDVNQHLFWKISNGNVLGTYVLGHHLTAPQADVPTQPPAPTRTPTPIGGGGGATNTPTPIGGGGGPTNTPIPTTDPPGGDVTWTQVNTTDTHWYAMKFVNANVGYVLGGSDWYTSDYGSPVRIAKTTDGGATWQVRNVGTWNGWANGLDCKDENTCWVVRGGGGAEVRYTQDGGATWLPSVRNDGWPAWLWSAGYTKSGNTVVVGTTGYDPTTASRQMNFIRAVDGKTFEKVSGFNGGEFITFDFSCPVAGTCYAAAAGRAYKTTNSGETWTINGLQSPGKARYFGIDCVSAENCWEVGAVWSGSGTQSIIRSTQNGTTWSANTVPALSGRPKLNDIDMVNISAGFAVGCVNAPGSDDKCTGAGMLLGTTNGSSWTQLNSPTNAELMDVYAPNANTLVVADFAGKIWKGTRTGGGGGGGGGNPTSTPTTPPGAPTATNTPAAPTPTRTRTPTPTGPTPTLSEVFIEAERTPIIEGSLGTLNIDSDPLTSACRYLRYYATDGNYDSGASSPRIDFTFNKPAGTYYMWARAQGASGTQNSFWVKNGNGNYFQYEIGNINVWGWSRVYPEGGSIEFVHDGNPRTISFKSREVNSQLDAILITNSGSDSAAHDGKASIGQCEPTSTPTSAPTSTPTITPTPIQDPSLGSLTVNYSTRDNLGGLLECARGIIVAGVNSTPNGSCDFTQNLTVDENADALTGTLSLPNVVPGTLTSNVHLVKTPISYLTNGCPTENLGPYVIASSGGIGYTITRGQNTTINAVLTPAPNAGCLSSQASNSDGMRYVAGDVTPTPYFIDIPENAARWPLLWVDTAGQLTYQTPIDYDQPQVSDLAPDLVVSSMSLYSDPAIQACVVELLVKVKNIGQTDAGAFSVKANGTSQKVEAGLKAGEEVSLRFNDYRHSTTMEPNTVTLDELDSVRELREDNNIMKRYHFLGSLEKPSCQDLVPTPPGGGGGNGDYPNDIPDRILDLTKANLKIKVRLQGIRNQTFSSQYRKAKFAVALGGGGMPNNTEFVYSDFHYLGNGVFGGVATFNANQVKPNYNYKLIVKGPKHLSRRLCTPNPSGGAQYYCPESAGAITLMGAGIQSFDFASVTLSPGDLPIDGQQDGLVDSSDLAYLRERLGRKDADSVRVADLNFDGIVDSQDYSLIVNNLINNEDER